MGSGVAGRQEAKTFPSLAQTLTLCGGLCWDHGVDSGCQAGEEVLEEEQGILWGEGAGYRSAWGLRLLGSPEACPGPVHSPGPR